MAAGLLAVGVVLAGRLVLGAGPQPNEANVVYGKAGGQDLVMDIYRPAGAEDPKKLLPAIVFVHGGGWVGGDKKDFTDLAAGFAKNEGYVSFNINYRLVKGTENQYPACLDDVQRAVRWVRANAARYHVDPRRVGCLGGSAGGHLVALLGTVDTRDNSDPALKAYSSRVTCVVDLFGPTDFTVTFPGPASGLDVQGLVQGLLGKPLAEAPKAYRDASPLFHVDKKTVPFLIFHGSVDPWVPLDQSQRFDAALRKAGRETELVVFQGEGHGFQRKENLDEFVKKTVAFFGKHLKGK